MERYDPSLPMPSGRVECRRTVAAPVRYEGIGNALRAAFAPSAYGLPEDLGRLLLRLDERGR